MATLDPPIRVAILTVSDRCSRGEAEDTSGPGLARRCEQGLPAQVVAQRCVPDDRPVIAQALRDLAGLSPRPDLILTTGGTGLAPRDVTPEATLDVLERRHEGLLELARRRCFDITPRTYLSRGEAGTVRQSLVINLPGSTRGSAEMFDALVDILPHAIETLRGDVQDDGRADATPTTGKVIQHDD